MKLNHECVRALLLTIEEEVTLKEGRMDRQLAKSSRLKDFSIDDIIYAALRLEEAAFIDAEVHQQFDDIYVFINNLTYEGHQLLDNIRDPNVWQETKKSISSVAGVSLSIISEVAASYLKERFGLS